MMKYKRISEGQEIRVENDHLYVKQTNMGYGMLEQGGYADRVYRMPFKGTLEDAQKMDEFGISYVDRCVEIGTVIRKGRLIH